LQDVTRPLIIIHGMGGATWCQEMQECCTPCARACSQHSDALPLLQRTFFNRACAEERPVHLAPGPLCAQQPPAYCCSIIAWGPQVKKPCASGTLSFAQESATANWYAKPSKTTQLKAGQGLATCQAACAKLAKSKTGCAAFSINKADPTAAVPSCDLYYDWVPQRVCTPADAKFNCKLTSQGSYRAKWVY
jgi:hypothetical protein